MARAFSRSSANCRRKGPQAPYSCSTQLEAFDRLRQVRKDLWEALNKALNTLMVGHAAGLVTAILLAYRHGLRASELVSLRWDEKRFWRLRAFRHLTHWHIPHIHQPTSAAKVVAPLQHP